MILDRILKAQQILQEWTDELVPLFYMPRVRIMVVPDPYFNDNIHAFADGEIIKINPNKAVMLGEEFKNILKHELVHVWMHRQGIVETDMHGPQFQAKCREVGI